MSYYNDASIVKGIGLNTKLFRANIDKDSLLALLDEQFPGDSKDIPHDGSAEELLDIILNRGFVGSLGELFWLADESDLLTYGDIGCHSFLYYPPDYPWNHRKNDPQCYEEVVALLVTVVQALAPSVSTSDIENFVGDIYMAD